MTTKKRKKIKNQKVWLLAVDMGYGHQRPAHSLLHLAYKSTVVTANNYKGIPSRDKNIWFQSRRFYEFISLFKRVPLIGDKIFHLYDRLQSIPKFYPKRDLSKPSLQVSQIYRLIEKKQWGKHLIEKLAKSPRPIVTTFFVTAFMAEVFEYPDDIYCLVTDTDITRAWVPKDPTATRIKYLAPSHRVYERLKLYGVPEANIFLTGFPLPRLALGDPSNGRVKHDLQQRLVNLDPDCIFTDRYGHLVDRHLEHSDTKKHRRQTPTIMFAVGGAGAQRDLGAEIMKSLKEHIIQKQVKLVLVAGIHNDVHSFFKKAARQCGLRSHIGKGVKIIHAPNKKQYFTKFDKALRRIDVLWTKPSELSFYCALGIPIIMAPTIGSQEEFNREWLERIGAGIDQEDPRYVDEWLFDWLKSGRLAEAALEGFVEAPRYGVFNIENIVAGRPDKVVAMNPVPKL